MGDDKANGFSSWTIFGSTEIVCRFCFVFGPCLKCVNLLVSEWRKGSAIHDVSYISRLSFRSS